MGPLITPARLGSVLAIEGHHITDVLRRDDIAIAREDEDGTRWLDERGVAAVARALNARGYDFGSMSRAVREREKKVSEWAHSAWEKSRANPLAAAGRQFLVAQRDHEDAERRLAAAELHWQRANKERAHAERMLELLGQVGLVAEALRLPVTEVAGAGLQTNEAVGEDSE